MLEKDDILRKQEAKVNTFRYFNIIYALALTIIALVTITSQVLIQNSLSNQLTDSHVVNRAGKQRMYSQKITKTCLQIVSGTWNDQIKQVLIRDIASFERSHATLREGLLVKQGNTKEVDHYFSELEEYFKVIISSANKLLLIKEGKDSLNNIHTILNSIVDAEYHFLILMDDIVDEYDRLSADKVRSLKRTEYYLMVVVLGVLLCEVIFIFQPAARRIRTFINSLLESELTTIRTAEKLNATNLELEEIIRQNRDINFALDKATVMIRTDEWGNILYANDKYQAITTYKEYELIGKPLFFNNQGGEESIIYKHIRNEKIKGTVWQGEVLDQSKTGKNFWLDVTMIPIEDAKGKLYQYLVVSSNITLRKEAELELQRINEEKHKEALSEQRKASYAIIEGQEKERKRMAVEIHDGVGQQLTALKFSVEALSSKDDKQENQFEHIRHVIYDTIKEARRISSSILPRAINNYGLGPAIKEMVKSLSRSVVTEINFVDELKLPSRLNKQIEVSLYRITQEAVNNAIKHAEANLIQINLKNDKEFLTLTVKDDGIGFDQTVALKKVHDKNTGNGLSNMKERAELINAHFVIESLPDLGVIISVQLPLIADCYV